MARCCQGASCACNIQGGANVLITGVGSLNDPFVITNDTVMGVVDSTVFNLTLAGAGTAASPWLLSLAFASTAKLNDIPDVNADAPTNTQVLGWDSATSMWTPRAPTTAAAGSVSHDTSLTGDGSGGSPLQVVEDPARYLSTTASGLGVTDAGVNQLVRKFADLAARTAASPIADLNSLSSLNTVPGKVDYWTGSQWLPLEGVIKTDAAGAELLNLSGAYINGMQLTMLVRKFTGVTDLAGMLTVLGPSLLTGKAGILSAAVSVTGAQAYFPVISPGVGSLQIVARRLDDGALLVSQAVAGQVVAYTY